ncbi:MAG: DUF1326 domain-containing protein [Alphaproteobacteria bacterium]|nr:DUF1326 domain-containing protein [Alphaproteobacteria bacterium]
MTYQLAGRMLEVCTCSTVCPCFVGEAPDGGTCDVTVAWHMDKGTIEGVDVTGRTIAAIAHIPGKPLDGNWRAAVYIDDGASESQEAALLDVFTGKLGGPVADVAKLIGEVVGVERVPITFIAQNGTGSLKIGDAADARTASEPIPAVPAVVLPAAPCLDDFDDGPHHRHDGECDDADFQIGKGLSGGKAHGEGEPLNLGNCLWCL